jgi:hypothetical protein
MTAAVTTVTHRRPRAASTPSPTHPGWFRKGRGPCSLSKSPDRGVDGAQRQVPDDEFVYLHSTRFDKFFRMSCSLDWTEDHVIEYLTKTPALPWNIELSAIGLKWSFS